MPAFDFVLARRYRLIAPLGEGGMATVYRGRDLRLNREVAIKILRDELTRDPDFLARFEREAQFVASLSHPNIVPVYDVGEEEGTRYIVMEYVRGRTLRDAIDSAGHIEPARAVNIMRDVLRALEYAHGRGLVHRDVKPHNILLTSEGAARLADFGIARLAEGSTTRTAAILGSAHYLSPEQARGEDATPASDIYACGIVLYEMLAGEPPFDGGNALAIAHHHVHSAPPEIDEQGRSIPTAVSTAIRRALAKDPASRYSDAGAFLDALGHGGGDTDATMAIVPEGDATQRLLPVARPARVVPASPSGGEDTLLLRRSARKAGVLAVLVAAILSGLAYGARASVSGYALPSYPSIPYAAAPGLAALALLLWWLHIRSWKYHMNGNAAVLEWGLVSRHRFGVPARYITSLELKQSPIDRVLGVGTVEVCARDQHGKERRLIMEDLPHPKQSYDDLMHFLGTALHNHVGPWPEIEEE